MRELSTEPRLAIEQVYRDERVALVRLAFLLTGSREAAEDVVQAVFAAAHPRWGTIEQPRSYLRRSVVNRANDELRRRYRRQPDPPALVTYQPEIDETWAELRRLPDQQRTVVVLRFSEHRSDADGTG